MLALAALLSLGIGVVLGTLGGGGAILTLPMLVYVLGVEPKAAIATSLFVVGTTSLIGMGVHARAGRVQWRMGAAFGAAAMLGSAGGAHLAHFVPGLVLLLLFATLMIVTALAMLKRREELPRAAGTEARPALGRALALGVGVGALSGLVGAGGGFLIVPALTLLAGLGMAQAVGTSLFVIALQSLTGFAVHSTHVELDWRLIAIIGAASIVGSLFGAALSAKVAPANLRRAFAFLVLATGLLMFVKELPPVAAGAVAAVALAAVFFVARSGPRAASGGADQP